ncbi:hypothetical protein AAZX31_09G076500 [Glycine max]|uniref:Uncharacterized protein n=2 Tax=Glycine subgen. Soja TaxID=1462606 RepID=A0A0R0IBH8_SOYBN|nr:hypothetical protein D0Y65_023524 [Glycine soja]
MLLKVTCSSVLRVSFTKRSFNLSLYNIFKACRGSGRSIFASHKDRDHWVAEPGIDRKAFDFIAKYYATYVIASQCQFAS